jgi:hypothetical protein
MRIARTESPDDMSSEKGAMADDLWSRKDTRGECMPRKGKETDQQFTSTHESEIAEPTARCIIESASAPFAELVNVVAKLPAANNFPSDVSDKPEPPPSPILPATAPC